MSSPIRVSLVDLHDPAYPRYVDRVRTLLGAPASPTVFPPHFLKATFPKIGGRIVELARDDREVAVGFLFPRTIANRINEYTLRLHWIGPGSRAAPTEVAHVVTERLPGVGISYYDPARPRTFPHRPVEDGSVTIGRPDSRAAHTIRELQQTIWGGEHDYLYPADIHSPDFGLGTSLIAASDDGPAGFLFGFYKFAGSALPPARIATHQTELRIESQLLGVLPEFRQSGLAARLKWAQAEDARRVGVDVINWTVDPLQFANAVLNFGRLRAIAFDFFPNYYDFRNDLNRLPASRVGVTWLVRSRRVVEARGAIRGTRYDVLGDRRLARLNEGTVAARDPKNARHVAIEIPADWTALQKTEPDRAARWRAVTDDLFAAWLGCQEGKYILTDVGRENHRCYLIGERVDDALLELLST